jgi:predicted enzyme related to lactoylglutathione lyase
VDTLQPDPEAAMAFYAGLMGWEFVGPAAIPGDPLGRYFVARLRGRDVAGVGSLPADGAPSWNTYVSVANADEAARRATAAGGEVIAGPFDTPPAGRMAAIRDPAGAIVCVWEPREREGAQVVNTPSAWAMSALQTTDLDGARAFYGEVFGWKDEPFEFGGARGSLWRLPGYVGGTPSQPVPRDVVAVLLGVEGSAWGVDFWIDDADAAAAKAAELGGSVVVPPHDRPGFRSAVLSDPRGAVFSVSKLVVG